MKNFDPSDDSYRDFFCDDMNLFVDCDYEELYDDTDKDYDLLALSVDKECYEQLKGWLMKAGLPLEDCLLYWIRQLYMTAARMPERDRYNYLHLMRRHIRRALEG